MKTAVIYARYSSERQTEQSIEGQLRVCHEYAEQHDILIVDTYIDRAMTGTNDLRDEFQRMMKDSAKQAWDYVLVYKFDRFSRDKYECTIHKHTLKENGIKLISAMENIPDSPEGIILESLLEGMNQYYSMELSQKVRRGMNESRHKGNFTGGYVLYGYRIENKKVIVDEDKAQVVRFIFEEYAKGTYAKDIITKLTEQGILNHGKPFAVNTIYHTLQNEKYAGLYHYNGELFDNIYPRIIPEDIFEIVQSKMKGAKAGKHVAEVQYLLKNKIRCGYCGKTITSDSGTGKRGNVYRYYKCWGKKNGSIACEKTSVPKDALEQLVVDVTIKTLSNPDLLSDLADKILELNKAHRADSSVLNVLIRDRDKLQKSIDNILSAIEEGMTHESMKRRLTDLEKQLDILEVKIQTERAKEKIQISRSDIIRYLKATVKKKPELMIRLLIKEILLYNDKIEIHYNYTERKDPDGNDRRDFCFYTEHCEIVYSTKRFGENREPLIDDMTLALDTTLWI